MSFCLAGFLFIYLQREAREMLPFSTKFAAGRLGLDAVTVLAPDATLPGTILVKLVAKSER